MNEKIKHILTLDLLTLHLSSKRKFCKKLCVSQNSRDGAWPRVCGCFFKVLLLKKGGTKHCGRLATSDTRSRCFLGLSHRERERRQGRYCEKHRGLKHLLYGQKKRGERSKKENVGMSRKHFVNKCMLI